jgi:hypothetical protein
MVSVVINATKMLEAPSVNPRCKGLCDGNIGFQPIFNNRFENV